MKYTIRHAKSNEADKLTKIAVLSKASWGYPKEWLEAWKPELTITPQMIEKLITLVAEKDNEIIGFWCREKINSDELTFGLLFIHPDYMRQGVAHALWSSLKKELIKNSIKSFTIAADPNAVPFYLKIGAIQIGMQELGTIPGRKTPILKISLM